MNRTAAIDRHGPCLVCLGVILIGALALRIGITAKYVGLDSKPDYSANPDQIDYELLAYRLSEGEPYALIPGHPTAHRAPGTSLSLLPAYAAFGRSYAAGRIWFCLLSACTCAVVGWIATSTFNSRTVGVVAAAWLALYPGHFYHAMHFVSETPFCFWLALAAALTVRSLRRRAVWSDVTAGVCWGMAVLTRPQLILVVPIALGLIAAAMLFRRRPPVRAWAVQTCVIAAVLAPWIVRNAVVLGSPALSTIGGHCLWGSNNEMAFNDPDLRGRWVRTGLLSEKLRQLPNDNEVLRDKAAMQYGKEFIARHLSDMPAFCAWKLWRLVSPITPTSNRAAQLGFALGWITAAPFVVLGLWHGFRRRPALCTALVLPILSLLVTAVIFYGSTRFRQSVAPVLIVFAAFGLVRIVDLVRAHAGPSLRGLRRPARLEAPA